MPTKKPAEPKVPQRELLETYPVLPSPRQRAAGRALREARGRLGLYLGDSARAIGMSVVDLCAVELGKRTWVHGEKGLALALERMEASAAHRDREAAKAAAK